VIAVASLADRYLDNNANVFVMSAGERVLYALGGDDNITGTSGNDVIDGGQGSDLLYGLAGDDRLVLGAGTGLAEGGAGADIIDGSGDAIGTNWKGSSYIASDAGVTIHLGTGLATGGHASGDTLININYVEGSGFADNLTGDANKNWLYGNDGDDILLGLGGEDTLRGGAGNDQMLGGDGNDVVYGSAGADVVDGGNDGDWVDYSESDAGVTINISLNTASGGHAQGDTLSNFEGIVGSNFNDTLTGEAGSNYLIGGKGGDTIAGLSGDDTLFGDLGVSRGIASIGDNTALADGSDTISGGAGNDIIESDTTLIRNGSFEAFVISASQPWGYSVSSLAGWTQTSGTGFEVVNTVPAIDGAHVLDMEVSPGNVSLSQVVTGLANGTSATLQIDARDFAPGGNSVEVRWGGVVIGTLTSIMTWSTWSFTVVAGANDTANTLELVGLGPLNGLGLVLDNIRMYADAGPADTIFGDADDDTIYAGGGNDIVDGGTGNDRIQAHGADDRITGGAGNDFIDGGTHFGTGDTAIYSGSRLDYQITFASGIYTVVDLRPGSPDGTDTVSNIENFQFADATIAAANVADILGTNLGDVLNGTIDANVMRALDGDDILNGSMGADRMDGGSGTDTVNYSGNTFGITVNLQTNVNLGHEAAGDLLYNIENVSGGAGHDSITGNALDNVLAGNDGDDLLTGGGGADTLSGGNGIDAVLYGTATAGVIVKLAATDALGFNGLSNANETAGGLGSDAEGDSYSGIELVYGTAFNDRIYGSVQLIFASLGSGEDFFDNDSLAASANKTILGGAGNDTIVAGAGNDSILAGTENDVVYGETGNDTINGEDGDDWLSGQQGNDAIDGGIGFDTIGYFGSSTDYSIGFEGTTFTITDIRATPTEGVDTVDAVERFWFQASGNETVVYLTNGSNVVVGDTTNNFYVGLLGDDTLSGAAGNDILIGAEGNDILDGGLDNDNLSGGSGDDTLVGDAGADLIDGGTGNDTTSYLGSAAGVTVDLASGVAQVSAGDASGDRLIGIENLTGSTFDDILTGTSGDNVLYGDEGGDTLIGNGGVDTLFGELGDDILRLDASQFSLAGVIANGGAGSDRVEITGAGSGTFAQLVGVLTNIETIDLTGVGVDGTLTDVSTAQVTAILGTSGPGNILTVDVDGSETGVTFASGTTAVLLAVDHWSLQDGLGNELAQFRTV
jgi:Ca2+-binding RTX toxin-like protein